MTNSDKGFFGLGIAPGILEVLSKLNFTVPTPIQERSIPITLEGKDLMGIAQTGTGKTLAFGIPLIQQALQGGKLGLIVAPTRELALQINETIRKIGGPLRIRTATLIGGEVIARQIRDLRAMPHIVVGTPGRIIDHLNQRTLSLQKTNMLVLDEADRMLDMGFAPQLRKIVYELPKERQTMIFSATMPNEIAKLANDYMKLPIRIEIAPSGETSKNVTQELFFVSQESKPQLLEKLLQEYRGSVLVFARTKYAAKRITGFVAKLGHTAAEIHSNRSLNQRREALDGFKTGKYRVLVATDIAARGIDVTNIELVLNYDLPQAAEDYVHRIGRTARAGGSGHAVSFARTNEWAEVRAIERFIRKSLPVSKLPELPPPPPFQFKAHEISEEPRRRFGGHRPGGAPRPRGAGRASKPVFGRKSSPFSRPGSKSAHFGPRKRFR